ncbi:hypothetical protein [Cyclobacterium xiamenense]|uniref:hypothetical protein n=1 Tax=Cyclobacterium xiamenense TaxID=1297121 RepID=UPI0012B8EFCB|nr:hypothetical protein [Cyclobacterium xiamenense]
MKIRDRIFYYYLQVAFIVFVLVLTSCTKEKNIVAKQRIFDLLKSYDLEHSTNTLIYYFIPLDGCGECIKTSIEFVNKNFNLNNVDFILISQLKKSYNMNFSKDVLKRENVIIDEKQLSKIYELVSNKPIIYVFNNGKIEFIFELDDQNSQKILGAIFSEFIE